MLRTSRRSWGDVATWPTWPSTLPKASSGAILRPESPLVALRGSISEPRGQVLTRSGAWPGGKGHERHLLFLIVLDAHDALPGGPPVRGTRLYSLTTEKTQHVIVIRAMAHVEPWQAQAITLSIPGCLHFKVPPESRP